ncbi:MAG: hypothetical protein NTX03_05860 [Bacteroidetes bacterium]|nr:hypothetical protein [Bacteroidota bacterium]
MIQILPEEQYTLLKFTGIELLQEDLEEMNDAAAADMEAGNCNFIVDISEVETISMDFYPYLDTLYNLVQKEEGILVVATENEVAKIRIEERGIVPTPTLSEAVDYIFMEELEKQLLGDGHEEEGLEEE